jgi:Mg2+/Co2+ transporter CorB
MVRACVILFSPATYIVRKTVRVLLSMFGVKPTTGLGHPLGDEELRGAIDLHGHTGEEERDKSVMLRSILDLADVEVYEVMTHRKNVIMVDIEQKNSTIIEQVLNSPYTRIPLWKEKPDNIVGILHAKQLLRAVRAHMENVDEVDILSTASPPWFIPDTTNLLDQLNAFRERREHFALVVDEYGGLLGVVTLEDILEEIVGDVFDEYDVSVAGVRPQGDGSYIVNGSVTLRDLNREFDWHLPDEEAVTVAGLILHEAAQIPDVGQVFTFHGLRFEVLRRQRNQITSVRITAPKRVDKLGAVQHQKTA